MSQSWGSQNTFLLVPSLLIALLLGTAQGMGWQFQPAEAEG